MQQKMNDTTLCMDMLYWGSCIPAAPDPAKVLIGNQATQPW